MQPTEVAVIEQLDRAAASKVESLIEPDTAACIRAIIKAVASITTAPANWPSG